ncbi:carboxylesterase/lipase family protein [Caulobacter sp. S45]|uniref:carboxylesterase/lipase family protein n=1 Tax=Caulobacter sp. S45 TaxID=1641861 RepID=UPI001576B27B|nr:carboxylesterase family protein [Caulobacter sp. S45]
MAAVPFRPVSTGGLQARTAVVLTALLAMAVSLGGCALRPGDVGYLVHSPDAQPMLVATEAGPVRGVATPQGNAFLALPYAAAPVGPLRWRAPRPPASWVEPRDATRGGALCPQAAIPGSGKQSEDCLTLNVYTPAGAKAGARLPVMVWIYGGGYAIGYTAQYDLSRIAQRQGVVTVEMNYRLGALGFLAHPALRAEGDGSGDYALLDQQAALRWVRANVSAFGGDPANVTIFGESAGGWSVCEQLTAPGAQGLFQRAIIESGACTAPDSAISQAAAEAGGVQMAADLGCSDPVTAAACLRALPAKEVLKAMPHRRGLLGKDSWTSAYGGTVLPLHPRRALEQGRFAPVPVIDGTNHDEARLFLDLNRFKGMLYSEKSYKKIISDFFLDQTPTVLNEYADEARRSYAQAYVDVVTDSTFACPALTTNALLERRVSVYAYEFDDPAAVNGLPRSPFTGPLKAFHSSEIAYVMQTPWEVAPAIRFDPAQRALSDHMQAWWAGFARSGIPDTASARGWAPDRGVGPLQLRPDGNSTASDFARRHRCAFWNALGY